MTIDIAIGNLEATVTALLAGFRNMHLLVRQVVQPHERSGDLSASQPKIASGVVSFNHKSETSPTCMHLSRTCYIVRFLFITLHVSFIDKKLQQQLA
jgi:hypothetical protein